MSEDATPPTASSPHSARSWFGIALGLAVAVFLLDEVHGVNIHTKPIGAAALFAAWLAALICLLVGLSDAGRRGRTTSLYYALIPVIGNVAIYHRVNDSFGGAGAAVILAWVAVALLVGIEAVSLVRSRSRERAVLE